MQSPQNSLTASDAERESAGRSDGDILASDKEEPLFADGDILASNKEEPLFADGDISMKCKESACGMDKSVLGRT